MELLGFWFFASLVVAVWASNRGRSGFAWWLVSMLLSPVLGALFVAVQPNLAAQRQAAQNTDDSDAQRVRCPACAEWVLPQAIKCKHCGGPLVPQRVPDRAAQSDKTPTRSGDGFKLEQQDVLLIAGFLLAVLLVVAWVVHRYGSL